MPNDSTASAPRFDPGVIAAVALGAALGGPARYGIAQLIHVSPDTFPWATFWTNVTGALALGVVLGLIVVHRPGGHRLRGFAATGFMGAYTTYSTFAVETDLLVKNGHASIALGYVVASLMAGVIAAMVGVRLAQTTARRLPDEESA